VSLRISLMRIGHLFPLSLSFANYRARRASELSSAARHAIDFAAMNQACHGTRETTKNDRLAAISAQARVHRVASRRSTLRCIFRAFAIMPSINSSINFHRRTDTHTHTHRHIASFRLYLVGAGAASSRINARRRIVPQNGPAPSARGLVPFKAKIRAAPIGLH